MNVKRKLTLSFGGKNPFSLYQWSVQMFTQHPVIYGHRKPLVVCPRWEQVVFPFIGIEVRGEHSDVHGHVDAWWSSHFPGQALYTFHGDLVA